MTAIARLTRAELRKLATTRTFLITLALSAGLAVISVVVDAWGAGKNGTPPLGTTASTYVSRRPTPARNRRRSAGSTDRSSASASSPRR
jgi:hypothetical protein